MNKLAGWGNEQFMGRKQRKKNKIKALSEGSIRFELEDNAEELFRAFLDSDSLPNKDDEHLDERTFAGRGKRRKSSKRQIDKVIDLHGQTLDEAKATIDSTFQAYLTQLGHKMTVQVITGRGLHSGPDGPILASHIHYYISNRYSKYIHSIDESPDDLRINGLPIRGHFTLTLEP